MNKIDIKVTGIISILFLSCSSLLFGQNEFKKQPYKIDFESNIKNVKIINLSSIGKNLTFIPLETTPDCLM